MVDMQRRRPAGGDGRTGSGRLPRRRLPRRRAPALALTIAVASLIGIDLLAADGGPRAAAGREVGTGAAPAGAVDHGPAGGTAQERDKGSAADRAGPDGTAGHPTPTAAALIPMIPPDGPAADPVPSAVVTRPGSYPITGPGTFAFVTGAGPVLGWAGMLRPFRVAVEDGIGQRAEDFSTVVEATLGDPRSWVASRRLRLQRVPRTASADFTVYLASPGTSERMCAMGGLATEKYTSCRLPGQVIINVERWLAAVPDYGAPLADYRAYAINHEVGHQFGMGHEACPAPGEPAPVMQQQTYGLRGCRANGWPYLAGSRYTGPPVP